MELANDLDKLLMKHQFYANVEKEEWKLESLFDIYESLAIPAKSVVCVNTPEKVEWLARELRTRGYEVLCLHKDMLGSTSEPCSGNYSSVLVTTHCFAQWIDLRQFLLAFNYDIPTTIEDYFRPIAEGGLVINFVTEDDVRFFNDIRDSYGLFVEELPSNLASFCFVNNYID